MTADRKCMFEGQDIEEACNYGIDPACLTGWQPAPDTWKPEKTADEMFRELGYERSCADEPPHCILYERNLNKRMTVQIYIWYGDPENDFVEAFLTDHGIKYDRNMSFQETLACAQLIREMEAEP